MAGRRWFASMGWWCLIALAIGGCSEVVAAESAAIEANSPVASGEEGESYRPLSAVLWGFLVTLLALTVSLRGSMKYLGTGRAPQCVMILLGVFAPLVDLGYTFQKSLRCVSLLWNCHKMEYPNAHIMSCSWLKFLCSSLFPWSKSPVRILASCHIVVYISMESPLLNKKWLWRRANWVQDESEAMVVGENGARAIRRDQYVRKELSTAGLGLLVWKEVFLNANEDYKRLPKYGELKYLRGNSGFAVIAIAVQALGYIYAVGYRTAKNLRISPLEVIGLVYNIILLIKVLFYSTCNCSHRPLVIYMDKDWEHEVGQFRDNNQKKLELYNSKKVLVAIFFGIFVGLSTLLIYYIIHIGKATNVKVIIPAIIFLAGLCLQFLGLFIYQISWEKEGGGMIIIFAGSLLNATAYIWAIRGTVFYWKTMHFNTRADLIDLSHIIPFIG